MTRYLIAYGAALAVLIALDFLWLGVVMRDFYKHELGSLMRERPLIFPAVLFYLVFAVGLTYFAAVPALEAGQWQRAAILGAAFGFFAYFTYDMTNFATLKSYSLKLVFADVIWGTVVSALSVLAGYFAVLAAARLT